MRQGEVASSRASGSAIRRAASTRREPLILPDPATRFAQTADRLDSLSAGHRPQDLPIGLGDASLYPSLLEGLGVEPGRAGAILSELAQGDFVAVEREIRELGLNDDDSELLLRVPRTRGGAEVLSRLDGVAARRPGRHAGAARPAQPRGGGADHL